MDGSKAAAAAGWPAKSSGGGEPRGERLQISATVGSQAPPAPPPGPVYIGRHYRQVGLLGQGAFGVVVRAVDEAASPPEDVAIKLLPRGDVIRQFRTYVTREILHQSVLKHPFVVALKEVFLTQHHLCIVMEYVQGGDLFQYVSQHYAGCRLPEDKARWLFQQLLVGLDYCHSQGVANRDLKLENILIDGVGSQRPLLKICDFGYSKHDTNSTANTGVGTPIYMSPEVVLGRSRYDAKKADLWSAGIILYAMLYGRYPFDTRDTKAYAQRIMAADYAMPEAVPVSAGCRQLIRALLVPDPEQRISLEAIKRCAWFLEGLPAGALEMNAFYPQTPGALERLTPAVEALVQLAQAPAQPGEAAAPLRL